MPSETRSDPSLAGNRAADVAGPVAHRTAPTRLVGWLQWIFVGFSVLNIALLLTGSDHLTLRVAALVGYAVAAVLSVVAMLLGPARGRRIVIPLHLTMALAQFVFSIPVDLALLGMPLSMAILALSRPRFPRMAPRTRKVWLTLHVGFSAGWLGVSLTMTVLALIGAFADSHAARHGAYEVLHVIDLAAAIPSMFLSIITGLVMSLGTKWGLVRHWWVITKFAISVTIPLLAGTVESTLADELALRTVDPAAEPGGAGIALTAVLAAFTVALWVATILSVVKPWDRTRWGRAADAREREGRRRADSGRTAERRADRPPTVAARPRAESTVTTV